MHGSPNQGQKAESKDFGAFLDPPGAGARFGGVKGLSYEVRHSGQRPREGTVAFTLVEIMIVVVIIGLLASMALPAFQKSRQRSQAARLTNDFRQYDSAFQRYLMENGTGPAAAGLGVVPAGMAGYLPTSYTSPSPIGGGYIWSGPSSNIVLSGSSGNDALMQLVDVALDDGDLTTGDFTKISATAYGMRVH
jgi:prepilin-type N-terminal cleavage/methylation domain-containing protein